MDDVDLLVVQFLDDGLDADALDAHAGSHRIHAGLGCHDRHLGARARLAGNGAHFDDAMIDLGDLVLQEAPQEIAMGARENDLRPA